MSIPIMKIISIQGQQDSTRQGRYRYTRGCWQTHAHLQGCQAETSWAGPGPEPDKSVISYHLGGKTTFLPRLAHSRGPFRARDRRRRPARTPSAPRRGRAPGKGAPAFIGRTERLGLAVLEGEFGLAARRIDLVSGLASTPSAFMSTRNSEIPVSRPLDPVRAATMAKSATAPSGTGFFTPLRLPPTARELDRLRRRIALAFEQRQRADRLTDAISGSHFCFCASLPASRMASAAEIHRRGKRHRRQRAAHLLGDHAEFEIARRRRRRIVRGSRHRENPCRRGPSTVRDRTVALPSSTMRTALGGHFSARNLRALSRNCFCSSEKSKFMAVYLLFNCHSGARAKLANPEFRCKEPLDSGSVRRRTVRNDGVMFAT